MQTNRPMLTLLCGYGRRRAGRPGAAIECSVAELRGARSDRAGQRADRSQWPALSTALQEQLGLKLEAKKDAVDVLSFLAHRPGVVDDEVIDEELRACADLDWRGLGCCWLCGCGACLQDSECQDEQAGPSCHGTVLRRMVEGNQQAKRRST